MLVPLDIQEATKQVSIRGRMAMAIVCLESVLGHCSLNAASKNALLDTLWQFVEGQNLAIWDDSRYDNQDLAAICEFFDYGAEIDKQLSISVLPMFVLNMIDDIVTIGKIELYGKVESYSPITHHSLLLVLNQALENGFSIPPIEPFLQLPFSQRGGWGEPTSRSKFIIDNNEFIAVLK